MSGGVAAAAPLAASAQHLAPASQAAAKAQTASESSDVQSRLAVVEKIVDAKRKELGIPGVSLVIVKDDKVIYIKGLGLKDVERGLSVTPETLFAIGSSTKAFTAMTAAIAADAGKLSLDDSPKKFLPYFKLRDPEADAKITIRDLLSHSSGLNRTDLAMVTGKLNRAEIIQVVGLAKPSAKFREKFQYQNVMYTAAGEAVAKAEGKTWEQVVKERVFVPLGMKSTVVSIAEMQKSPDFSFGYEYNAATKETRKLPARDILEVAPAGAINSNARDMGQWLRLMLGSGTLDGKRVVSEKNFNELISKQMNVAGNVNYGLGWFLREWKGRNVVEHGGNIDGFNALVAVMPEKKLGFAMLTNVTGSPLGLTVMDAVWSNLAGGAPVAPSTTVATAPAAAGDIEREVGNYLLAQAHLTFDVALKEGNLVMTVPGQPPYTLVNIGGRRYKLADPAPPGFFVTFRPAKDKESETEVYLEQPHGNYVLSRVTKTTAATIGDAAAADYSGPMKELIGSYDDEKGKGTVEIALKDGKVSLVVPGQSPYALAEREKDTFATGTLPDSYRLFVRRDAAGKVSGLTMKQPEGEFAFRRAAEFVAPVSIDELMAKVVAAAGGEATLRKHKTMISTFDVDFENQGVTGEGTISARAPNAQATSVTLYALGKKIGTSREYFDGTAGADETSFTPIEVKAGKQLVAAKISSDFYTPLNWKTLFKTVVLKKMSKAGDEDVYVVVKTPENGNPVTDYISTKSFLVLRRDSIISSNTTGVELPVTEYFSDYRAIDGVMVPFKSITNHMAMGDIVARIKDVKFDIAVPDEAFRSTK
jgi:CubicO group peptidase (beta-lactamase class C family)